MGRRLALHRGGIRWMNKYYEDFDGINAPLKWSRFATMKWFRKHIHDKEKFTKKERRRIRKLSSSSEYKLKDIRYWKKVRKERGIDL